MSAISRTSSPSEQTFQLSNGKTTTDFWEWHEDQDKITESSTSIKSTTQSTQTFAITTGSSLKRHRTESEGILFGHTATARVFINDIPSGPTWEEQDSTTAHSSCSTSSSKTHTFVTRQSHLHGATDAQIMEISPLFFSPTDLEQMYKKLIALLTPSPAPSSPKTDALAAKRLPTEGSKERRIILHPAFITDKS